MEDMKTGDWIVAAVGAAILSAVVWFIASAMDAHWTLTVGLIVIASLLGLGQAIQAATKREQAARADAVNRQRLSR